MTRRGPLATALLYLAAALLGVFAFGPFVLSVIASITPEAGLLSFPPDWFRHGFTLDNYRYIFTGEIPQSFIVRGDIRSMISEEIRHVPTGIFNSVRVAVPVMIVNVVLGSMAAYAMARLRWPGRDALFNFIMASRLIPAVALALPYYGIIQSLRLLNNPLALVLIYSTLTLPLTILLLTATFLRVPRAIEEAAQLDGLGPFQVLLRITLPLTAPGVAGTALFAFMLSYSEFLFALLLATRQDTRTLPVMLASVSVNPDVSVGLLHAAVVIGALPTLLVVVPIWRYMIQGLSEGSSG
ncbi:MAG TPA: carbohydrate ABC transporter permease [Candidatus Limnocylindrales bacterium]|nr:carbohydrate ABC transporter permease [Candidatus Limnocylindrales bacterium]